MDTGSAQNAKAAADEEANKASESGEGGRLEPMPQPLHAHADMEAGNQSPSKEEDAQQTTTAGKPSKKSHVVTGSAQNEEPAADEEARKASESEEGGTLQTILEERVLSDDLEQVA